VSADATLTIAVGANDQEPRRLVVGLFGEAAPDSVNVFRGLCDGTLQGMPGVTYRGSTVSRVERDKLIVGGTLPSGAAQDLERSIDSTGYVRQTLINRADAFTNADTNDLVHDRPGVVSMQRGGGDFRFTIAPQANRALDEGNVVVGNVLLDAAESAAVLAAMNEVPVRQPKAETSLYLALGKAGGDPRTRIETVYRPLQKISVVGCQTRER
jgi:cyclophilin family peptidyl-prolyl cis-trans isomerase